MKKFPNFVLLMETGQVKVHAFRWLCDAMELEGVLPSYKAFLCRNLGEDGRWVVVPCKWRSEDLEDAAAYAVTFEGSVVRSRFLCSDDRGSAAWEAASEMSDTKETCPVCLEEYSDGSRDGPLNHPWPTLCTHWACRNCWAEMGRHLHYRCPVCREDTSKMVLSMLTDVAVNTGWLLGQSASQVRRTMDGAVSVVDLTWWACGGTRSSAFDSWRRLEEKNPDLLVNRVRYVPLGPALTPVLDCEEALRILPLIPGIGAHARSASERAVSMLAPNALLMDIILFSELSSVEDEEHEAALRNTFAILMGGLFAPP